MRLLKKNTHMKCRIRQIQEFQRLVDNLVSRVVVYLEVYALKIT